MKLYSALLVLWFVLCETYAGYDGKFCVTPNSEEAVCRKLQHCPAFFGNTYSQEFLAASTCGYEATQYRTRVKIDRTVCCGKVGYYQNIKGVEENKDSRTNYLLNNIKKREVKSLLPGSDVCGQSESADRIIGGKATTLGEYPWMALLAYVNKTNHLKPGYHCGGSLINERYVLTAAHCVVGPIQDAIGLVNLVRLGEFDVRTDIDCLPEQGCNDPPVDVLVQEIIVHEGYDKSYDNKESYNDIALLRLKTKVEFTDFIIPICLPINGETAKVNDVLFAAGWGRTAAHGDTSPIKLKVALNLVDSDNCSSSYLRSSQVRLIKTQICAGGKIGQDTCGGDSGGPLMALLPKSPTWYIEGITSFGPNLCGKYKIPGVYTRVADYIDWIKSKLKP